MQIILKLYKNDHAEYSNFTEIKLMSQNLTVKYIQLVVGGFRN